MGFLLRFALVLGDINAIYKQWKKIRDRYVREKRKMRMSANGESEEPTWDLFRELMWIDPYLEERAALVSFCELN